MFFFSLFLLMICFFYEKCTKSTLRRSNKVQPPQRYKPSIAHPCCISPSQAGSSWRRSRRLPVRKKLRFPLFRKWRPSLPRTGRRKGRVHSSRPPPGVSPAGSSQPSGETAADKSQDRSPRRSPIAAIWVLSSLFVSKKPLPAK